jgi:hypothetical protein
MPERNTEEDYRREDQKLAAAYAKTDRYLVAHAKAGLDIAVERLMSKPELATRLVDGTL